MRGLRGLANLMSLFGRRRSCGHRGLGCRVYVESSIYIYIYTYIYIYIYIHIYIYIYIFLHTHPIIKGYGFLRPLNGTTI